MKKLVYILIFINLIIKAGSPSIIFKENKGQWPEKVLFGAEYSNSKYFLTKTGFRICVYGDAPKHSHETDTKASRMDNLSSGFKNRRGHVYEVNFIGANFSGTTNSGEQAEYYNFFLGNVKSRWAGNVHAYEKITYNDFYPKINFIVYSNGGNLKYDFELKQGASVQNIEMNYKYTNGIELKDNKLTIKTSVAEVKEYEPYAYQIINGKKKIVKCNYVLLDELTVGFDFPEGYNKNYNVTIDPTVIVCSYSKSTVWSNCIGSSYDIAGNIFVLGYSDSGYPTDSLSFQDTAMGNFDIILSKYNANGTTRIFSTYLGGNTWEIPQNVIINNYGIYIFAQTSSTNFPVTLNGFDTTANGLDDLTMSRLNLQGSQLLGSTYIGGSTRDGTNDVVNGLNSPWQSSDGQIIGHFVMDDKGNSYCVSASMSSNFPVSTSAFQNFKNGFSDAVVFKMDSTLSSLVWSTYIGGTSSENGIGIRHDGNGGAYISGSTISNNFPTTTGVIQSTDLVNIDMYITHINNTGTGLIASTYLGTAAADWGYFIDIDQNNDIYLCGLLQTAPSLTPTPGIYSSALGKNTIYKVNSSLTSLIYKTKFGTQIATSNNNNIVYTAFEVDSCSNIYIAGTVTNTYMPTSTNAIQSIVQGPSDMYFAVFRNDMSSLGYGTYFGGPRDEHVDGGISNFTKRGMLYQGICSSGRLPVTSGAYNEIDLTTIDTIMDNDAFVKIDFQTFINAGSSYGANISGCPPFTTQFVSTTNTGSSYWNLGDGTTTTFDTITHTYNNLGTYNVLLIVTDTSTCNRTDSIKSILNIINPVAFDLGEDVVSCIGVKALLKANISAITYSWSSGQTTPNIYALPGTYTLTINNGGCNSSAEISVVLGEKKLSERFPNVITPNGDNINDFIEFVKYNFEEVEFYLYDRWGKERFKITNPIEKWQPDQLDNGTYFWVVNYKSNCTGKHNTDKGFISVFK